MNRLIQIIFLVGAMATAIFADPTLQNVQISPDQHAYINFVQNNDNGAGNTEFSFINSDVSPFHFATMGSASPGTPYDALFGLHMEILGSYDIVASSLVNNGGNERATVAPSGTGQKIEIFGNGGGLLTANLSWLSISSNSQMTNNLLNVDGVLNLS